MFIKQQMKANFYGTCLACALVRVSARAVAALVGTLVFLCAICVCPCCEWRDFQVVPICALVNVACCSVVKKKVSIGNQSQQRSDTWSGPQQRQKPQNSSPRPRLVVRVRPTRTRIQAQNENLRRLSVRLRTRVRSIDSDDRTVEPAERHRFSADNQHLARGRAE